MDALSGLSILVVDDYPDSALSMAALLKIHGHHARFATNGQEAIRLFISEPADLVLLDLGLPGMSGYEVAIRIRELMPSRRPTIIAITGLSDFNPGTPPEAAGIDHFLLKPVAMNEFWALISRIHAATHDG